MGPSLKYISVVYSAIVMDTIDSSHQCFKGRWGHPLILCEKEVRESWSGSC